ncbi:MAG: DUF2149 domain-containing protein [Colwellia sp.]|nr:DUF2149 domain-containing protein [Colwellia sp.]
MRLLDEDEGINPALSVVNLVDVFLVLIAALLIAIAQNPLNPFLAEDVTVIINAGKDNMEIIVKKGNIIESFKSDGKMGAGTGKKAGTAYEMADGSMIYVKE